jgi:hypothetical protein
MALGACGSVEPATQEAQGSAALMNALAAQRIDGSYGGRHDRRAGAAIAMNTEVSVDGRLQAQPAMTPQRNAVTEPAR